MRSWIVRAGREWPLWIAVLGILSLFLLPRAVRFGTPSGSLDQRELDALRREVETGDPAVAEARLADFLVRHAQSPLVPDAQLLQARAVVARAQAGGFPGAPALDRAWAALGRASRTPETNRLRRATASLMVEYGLVRDGVSRLRELFDESHDPELALELAPALARLAALEPHFRHAHLDEASARISDYLRAAPPEKRVAGLLAQARVYREAGRDEDLVKQLGAELAETRTPEDRGRLHLERGRAFTRLGKTREMEAMSSFDEAEKLLTDPFARGLAAVNQALLFVRAGNPDYVEFCNRTTDSPAAPLAGLVVGVDELRARPAAALDSLRAGLVRIRRPRLIDDAVFDFDWVYAALRAAAERETDVDRLARFASVWSEISRLQPVSARVGLDHAGVLLRAKRHEEAADRYLSAGAIREAADACAEGGLHLRAAELYRAWFELQPGANAVGLHHRALSLKKAGDAAGAAAGFEEYVVHAGPSGALAGAALLEKASLQEPAEALATYDRILKAKDVATSPARDDWARALLGRGRTLVRLAKPADARKVLEEYLERYAEGPAPAPASIEAAWLLVQAAIAERRWKTGLARVADLDAFASKVLESDRAPYAEILKEVRFVEGDLHFNLDDFDAATRAYGDAVRRFPASEDRLWGLIGRARALVRLRRMDEARKDYRDARAIVDGGPAGGRGREYWEIALDALAREVR